jgi:hypothetical protein
MMQLETEQARLLRIANEIEAKFSLLREQVREAAVLLDFEAHLGNPPQRDVLYDVVRRLTEALESADVE